MYSDVFTVLMSYFMICTEEERKCSVNHFLTSDLLHNGLTNKTECEQRHVEHRKQRWIKLHPVYVASICIKLKQPAFLFCSS